MQPDRIEKHQNGAQPAPNLADYQAARAGFTWRQAADELGLTPGGSVNIAGVALHRHLAAGHGQRTALRWLAADGGVREHSYADLAAAAARFANLLGRLGVGRGERVFTLLGRVPQLYQAALGTWTAGAVFSPLFSAFGPEPVAQRMQLGDARILVTDATLYRRKCRDLAGRLPGLTHILLTGGDVPDDPLVQDLDRLLAAESDAFAPVATAPEELATLHFTSGTTGTPKGAMHVHGAVVAHYASARFALDLRDGDAFWCTADPGWVTGTSYGIVAPLACGATMLADQGEFDAERWYRTLAEQRINVWYTAPTAIRMLMKQGDALPGRFDLSALRFMASVGEPLNPEAVLWSQRVLARPFHDNWWQTETGAIVIANYASQPVKPGSMGRPLPGIEAAVVRTAADGAVVVLPPGEQGELALRPGWPSMFRGYLNAPERYAKAFADGWYLTGDLARTDEDGYFWFVGRADDVIKSAGHLIGPFEVESVLMEHPAVAEAAAIGMPDPVAMEVVKAFVALKPGHQPGEALNRELMALARRRLGPAIAPREIAFRAGLPKTRSGKIMRRLLKARELGLPEGDLSTLEEGG